MTRRNLQVPDARGNLHRVELETDFGGLIFARIRDEIWYGRDIVGLEVKLVTMDLIPRDVRGTVLAMLQEEDDDYDL